MKTRRRGSHPGCSLRQSLRAAATSGRSCSAARVVFFRAQAETMQLVPEGVDADRYPKVHQTTLLQLRQADVRLAAYPAADRSAVLLQPRAPVAADLLGPKITAELKLLVQARHGTPTHTKALAHLDRTGSCLPGLDDPTPQILTQWCHGYASMDAHCSTPAPYVTI